MKEGMNILSVLDNAYLRKAQEHPSFNPIHQKILLILMHEKKYFEKGELLCVAGHSLETLDEALAQLEKAGLIQTEGWLVKLIDENALCETITEKETGEIRVRKRR